MASTRLIEHGSAENLGYSERQNAMDNLQSMFPAIDAEFIQAALDRNQHALEATVDYLVALTHGDTVRLLKEELGGPPRYMEEVHDVDTVQPTARPLKTLPHSTFSENKVKKTSKYSKRSLSVSKKGEDEETELFLHNYAYTGSSDEEDGPQLPRPPARFRSESVGEKLVRTLSLNSVRRKQCKNDPFVVNSSYEDRLLTGDQEEGAELGPASGYHQI